VLFGFLTTEINAIVAPIHPKAMPFILATSADIDRWLEADIGDALALQRPLPDGALRIVASAEERTAPPKRYPMDRWCDYGSAIFAFVGAVFWFLSAYGKLRDDNLLG
jgi:hypothetical protein